MIVNQESMQNTKAISIVGSRAVTPYDRQVTTMLEISGKIHTLGAGEYGIR